jgi:2-polyprenyl-3-methyl-5-hydroxy-6-metoxy-1,4-benzoquinol methylase
VFESRSTEMEFLDRPDCDPLLAAASYQFMEMINCYWGGTRTVRRFLSSEVAGRNTDAPLRVLDIGSGSCDIPLAVSRWANARGIPMQITCLEMADHAVEIARRKIDQTDNSAVRLIQEDVFTYQPDRPYDCAIASMCFHHFSDTQIRSLLERLSGFVLRSVLINDLRRSRMASLAAQVMLAGKMSGVRHDALLSIQRGFKVGELNDLLQKLSGVTVSVRPALWFRIAAIIRFKSGENL